MYVPRALGRREGGVSPPSVESPHFAIPPTRARGFGRTRTRGRPSRWVSVRATGQEGRKDKEVSRQVSVE